MKTFYIAVMAKDEHFKRGFSAYVIKCAENDNLCSVLSRCGSLIAANIMPTKKRAYEVVNGWNDSFKANGNYY